MTVNERKAYIAAMQCLMSKPSKLAAGKFPGATNRYEDFVVVHMQQTLQIHGTVRNILVTSKVYADTMLGKLLVLAQVFYLGI